MNSNSNNFREMYWDESNRLRVVNDNDHQIQHYIYDGAGERILKASSQIENVYENGQVDANTTTMGLYTTYVSPYMVVDANQKYSKHYFNGTQRVASKIGEQDITMFDTNNPYLKQANSKAAENTPSTDFDALKNKQITDFSYYLSKNGTTTKNVKVNYTEYKKADANTETTSAKTADNNSAFAAPQYAEIYYYHSDHLGTGTFLSDIEGNPYQFFLNLPFGETMAEQHSYSGEYTNRYKFNGKVLDEETGFYYYGARYYNPKFSIWLSTDPLAEKLPQASPYAFCLNNPILFVDPDGQFPWPWFRLMFVGKASKSSDNNAFKQAATNLNKEYTDSKASIFYISTGKEIVNEINNASKKIQSIDFFSHSGHNGMFFTHDEWFGDNDFYINDAEENKVAGYWNNDSADLSEIDYAKFTNDAKVEFHGCNSGNKDFADNMASEFSKNMYSAGKTKSVAIGHGTKANPNSETLGNDYRHGLRRVYHNGNELFTTKREGRIPSRIINRFLKQKEKQGESYDGSNQRW